ncbi:MAG: DUF881 domain-containing protein [Candidatus Nanopelagicales bacterium]
MTPPTGSTPDFRQRLNLIEQLSQDAVASDYAQATATPSVGSRRQHLLVAATALALTGLVLAMGVSSRISNEPAVVQQREELAQRVRAAEAQHAALTAEVAALRADVATAVADNLAVTEAGRRLAEDIRSLEVSTGYLPVTGPGVAVTLTDAPADDTDDTEDLGRVYDTDVQRAVNGLWSAGAEAVAVNGQRLSARSAIRSAAGAILVNYRPLAPPYVIEAIGSPRALERDFLASADAGELRALSQQFGIGFQTRSVDEVALPAATSTLPEHAQVVEPKGGDGQ